MAPLTYDADQIQRYYDRIKLPSARRVLTVDGLDPETSLAYLKLLQQHHLVAIPFESLSLHYGPHTVSLHPDALFRKVVCSNGRGGYCMENNFLFGTLLRSVGYTLYPAGARVMHSPEYTGFGHMINIVTIGGRKYHVDVGFGPNGLVAPMPINHDELVLDGIAPATHRLVYKNIEENTDPDQRLWVLQHRNDDSSSWTDLYCYTLLEFIAADFRVMNHWASSSRKTIFTSTVICVRMIFGKEVGLDDKADEIVGVYIMMGPKLKKRVGGGNEVVADMKSEEERVRALKDHFDIELAPADEAAIVGLPSAIVATAEP